MKGDDLLVTFSVYNNVTGLSSHGQTSVQTVAMAKFGFTRSDQLKNYI